ncbi:sucrose-6-phosphate hydrolase [Jeotgalibacillus sp. S-D1]|uniref:glycoside hydrolase family 32 protein n=1 Tax=Jeotgalibacillus sp. S-D1 TaxID=2552189 RepID=UPI0010595878|nr:sucrose-6-phosphate hydrolase [Jeotgalibacillus sp. S-D1]TDL31270.1 sucrose-6-phosphate hydrolase [Jeotgalibacillus sp. S-D1]
MEWTTEQRYRRLSDASEDEIKELKKQVDQSQWRQHFHIQPETGLLNDPNGFSYFNGEYHLFYQWFPLGPVHGMKHWYHVKSTDLVHWEQVGLAIEPEMYFESHGAFSGSGLEVGDALYLFYTGNTRDEEWVRKPYQCMAVMNKNGHITKFNEAVIDGSPSGYSEHFRDPKLWKDGEDFFAVIGAQRTNETGTVLLYRSKNLTDWNLVGEIKTDLSSFGYMWECPDYLEIADKGIFIFSPQGIEAQGDLYQNIYQSGYLLGEKLDNKTGEFIHGPFVELDRGFDFYAPQTMLDPDGRRVLVGWMGLPEVEDPSAQDGWSHCLTLPRELTLKGNKMIQRPVKELEKLRRNKCELTDRLAGETKKYDHFTGETYEMIVEFDHLDASQFGLELRTNGEQKTVIAYDSVEKKVIVDRTAAGTPVGEEYGTVRKASLDANKVKFHAFVDVSSIEVFVNDGEEVFTLRIYPQTDSKGIHFFAKGGEVAFQAVKWDY